MWNLLSETGFGSVVVLAVGVWLVFALVFGSAGDK